MSKSFGHLCTVYNVKKSDLIYKSVLTKIVPNVGPSSEELAIADAIRELTGTAHINVLTRDDRDKLTTQLCTFNMYTELCT